jgi:cellobiose-specific phosphotransferase system component IIA
VRVTSDLNSYDSTTAEVSTAGDAAPEQLSDTPLETGEPMLVADAGSPLASDPHAVAARDQMQGLAVAQKTTEKLLRITKEAQGFEVQSFWGNSEQMETPMKQASDSLNVAHQCFHDALAAYKNGDYATFESNMHRGYEKLSLGLATQGRAAEAFSGDSDTRANWAKFVRDSAVETDIALLSLYTGGAGSLAGRAQCMRTLATNSPKLAAAMSGLLDSTIMSMPHLLPKIQDNCLAGMSPAMAVGQAFVDVGAEGVFGAVMGAAGQGLFKLGAAGFKAALAKAYQNPAVKSLFDTLRKQMKPEEYAQITNKFERKIKEMYDGAATKYNQVEKGVNKAAAAVDKANYSKGGAIVYGNRTGQGFPIRMVKVDTAAEANFVTSTLQHSDEISMLANRSAHDLIGNGQKMEPFIRKGLGSESNIRQVGRMLQGMDNLEEMLGKDLCAKKVWANGPKGRVQVTVGDYIKNEGIYGLQPAALKKVEEKLAQAQANGKLLPVSVRDGDKIKNLDPAELLDVAKAAVFTERARQAHAAGALHHQLFDEMGQFKGTDPNAFLSKLQPKNFIFDGPPHAISEQDVKEAAIDVVHAWVDGSRGYKRGMDWQKIEGMISGNARDGFRKGLQEFSPIQQQYLRQAMVDLQAAEKLGQIHPNGDALVMSRLSSAWVYASQRFWDKNL